MSRPKYTRARLLAAADAEMITGRVARTVGGGIHASTFPIPAAAPDRTCAVWLPERDDAPLMSSCRMKPILHDLSQMEFFPFLAHALVFAAIVVLCVGVMSWYLLFRVWSVKSPALRGFAVLLAGLGATMIIMFLNVGYLGW
jgi:hypothetical protein